MFFVEPPLMSENKISYDNAFWQLFHILKSIILINEDIVDKKFKGRRKLDRRLSYYQYKVDEIVKELPMNNQEDKNESSE